MQNAKVKGNTFSLCPADRELGSEAYRRASRAVLDDCTAASVGSSTDLPLRVCAPPMRQPLSARLPRKPVPGIHGGTGLRLGLGRGAVKAVKASAGAGQARP